MAAKEKKAVDFEQQLENLEALVESLESGDLSLEESLKSFEQGIKVARECQTASEGPSETSSPASAAWAIPL